MGNKDAGKMQNERQMLARILKGVRPLGKFESARLSPALRGRMVARDVECPRPLPAGDVATMDGYAVRSSDAGKRLPIAGESWAGTPFAGEAPEGGCVKIATGALVPVGLDMVVPWEDATLDGGHVTFENTGGGDNIRRQGAEISRGDVAVRAGAPLTARNLALLCGLGVDRILLHARPRVGIVSTGDEVRDVGEHLPDGALYDANRPMLAALLGEAGLVPCDLGIARDDAKELRNTMAAAAADCDAVVTIGGASVGERDLVKDVLGGLGKMSAWKVAVKPGKPLVFGELRGKPMFGLPGNPGSAYVTFFLFVLPGLWKLAGMDPIPELRPLAATLTEDVRKTPGRADYMRAVMTHDGKAGWLVTAAKDQGSGSLPVLSWANCLVRFDEDSQGASAGDTVDVYPLESLP